jgi:hypothetical protein
MRAPEAKSGLFFLNKCVFFVHLHIMKDPYNKAVVAAMKKDEKQHTVKDFDCYYVHIKHQDKSEFKIHHAKIERIKVKLGKGKRELDCILVYPEHNTVNLFVEADLKSVEVKPWKGRKYKLKIKSE